MRSFGRGERINAVLYPLGGQDMARKSHIKQYTAEKLAEMVKNGESLSDWEKAESLTYEEIEAATASDPDEADMIIDWDKATIELPQPKALLNMRVDREVLEYFRKTGKGYQSRINAVLRSYVDQKTHRHHHG